jgi:predicted DNA-binding antitoxin AbrB/MazE fold protein
MATSLPSTGAGRFDALRSVRFTRDMKTIHAIYENGVFRPLEGVDLPEASEVEFEPRPVDRRWESAAQDDVYSVLGRRFRSGENDVAARHDEHQP